MFGILAWIVIIACSVLMYRVAEIERLPGFVWGALTFALCIGSAVTIPLPYVNIVIGLIISFIAMTVYNAKYGSPP